MAVNITYVNDELVFKLNGATFVRNFQCEVLQDKLRITNAYDSKFVILKPTNYSEITLNGAGFGSALLASASLSTVLFLKQGLTSEVTSSALGNLPTREIRKTIDFGTEGFIKTKMATAIRTGNQILITNGHKHLFYADRLVLTNAESPIQLDQTLAEMGYTVIRHYFELKTKIPLVNGQARIGTGGNYAIGPSDLIEFEPVDYRDLSPNEFNLNDIGNDSLQETINEGITVYSVPTSAPNIFKAIQGGVAKVWLYTGEAQDIGNVGGAPPAGEAVFENDFRLFSPGTVDSTPTNNLYPIPNYTGASNLITHDTHRGRYYAGTGSTEDVFTLAPSSRLGAKTYRLVDRTNKSDYPLIKGKYHFTISGTNGSLKLTIGLYNYTIPFYQNEDNTVSQFIVNQGQQVEADTGANLSADGDILEIEVAARGGVKIETLTGDMATSSSPLMGPTSPRMIGSPPFKPGYYVMETHVLRIGVTYQFHPVFEQSNNVIVTADDVDETPTRKWLTDTERSNISSNTSAISNIASTIRTTVLTGLSTASSTIITASDSVLSALGKLQSQIFLKADKSNVLEKNNSTVFSPSQDYHPATKKYVDDNAGGSGTVSTSLPVSGDGSLGSPITIGNNAIALNKLADGAGGTDDVLAVASNGNIEAIQMHGYSDSGTNSLDCSKRFGYMYGFSGSGYTGTGITVPNILSNRKAGGFARMLINRSSKPSVSGTGIFRELQSDDWVNGRQYELFLECVYVHPSSRSNDIFHYQFRYTRSLSV